MRTLTGIGTPRGSQGRFAAVLAFFFTLWTVLRDRVTSWRLQGLDLKAFVISSHRPARIRHFMM
jgi:hypothetical protein